MTHLHTEPTTISGYQICEGCGGVMVTGNRAFSRGGVNGSGYVHTLRQANQKQDCRRLAYSETAVGDKVERTGYLVEKESIERNLFPHSSREMYGELV